MSVLVPLLFWCDSNVISNLPNVNDRGEEEEGEESVEDNHRCLAAEVLVKRPLLAGNLIYRLLALLSVLLK